MLTHLRTTAAAVPLALAAALLAQTGADAGATTLHAAAAGSGRTFGASFVAARTATDPVYADLVNREFGVLTPESELLWATTEPQRGVFDFGPAEQAVAAAGGRKLRGHVLLWTDLLPAWANNLSGAANVRAAMSTHISTVVPRLAPHVSEWEVVSEAFADTGARRPNVFQNAIGDGYVEEAFRLARAADPAVRLCYNDYHIEAPDAAKTQAVHAMVQDFKARGVPLDCVTFGSHFDLQHPVPAGFATTLQRFADLGVDVELSELDVAGSGATQAADYAAAVNACLAVPRCTTITVNGVRDRDTWRVASTPTLFFDDGTPKLAYAAVLDALNAAAGAVPTTTTTTASTTTTTRTCRWWPRPPYCR